MKNLVLPLLIIAFLLRLLYIHELHLSPFSNPATSGLDVSIYDTQAQAISKGMSEDEVFYAMPLYPYLVGFIYFLFGHNLYIVRFFQIVIGTLNLFLIYIIGKRLFDKNGTSGWADRALLALVLSCLYGVFIFYEGLLVPTTLLLFLDLIAIVLLINDNLTKGRVFIAGLLIGLGSLCQGSNILFGLLLFIWFLIIFKFNRRKVIVHSALFCAAMLAVILPVTVRNFLVGGDLVPITAHGGINFYIGNNPDATGTFNPPDGMSSDAEGLLMDSKRMAEEAMGEKLKPSQVSRFWYSKGLEFIRKEPVKYLSLLCRKALLFLNGKEVSDVEDFEFHRMFFPKIYQVTFLDFRIIGPLGLLGLGLSFRHRRREFAPVWLFLISFMASSILFFVNSRYRFPVVPVFILFAGYALWWGRDAAKEKRFKDLFIGVFILLCLSVLMNLRLFTQNFATSYYGIAIYYTDKLEYDKALKEYEKVLRLEPQMPGVHNNIGNIYYEKGDREKAIREYKEEIRLFPGHAKRAYYNLGTIYLESGKYEEAKMYLSNALNIDPDYKEAKDALKKANIH